MINDNDFLEKVRNRQYLYIKDFVNTDGFGWYNYIKFIKEHPAELTEWSDSSKRVDIQQQHKRPSNPDFAKNTISWLEKIFTNNVITCMSFCGLEDSNKSFKIHRDFMDVFYVQVIGSVEWSIWESECGKESFDSKDYSAKMINSQKLSVGDAVYVPRGIYHKVDPYSSRVGFSFGIEGDINPSTYI